MTEKNPTLEDYTNKREGKRINFRRREEISIEVKERLQEYFDKIQGLGDAEKERLNTLTEVELADLLSVFKIDKFDSIKILNDGNHSYLVSGFPIGKGALGAVYKGYDLHRGRKIALKVSTSAYKDDAEIVRLEAQTQANERHPNILEVYDGIKSNDTTHPSLMDKYILVMEYIPKEEGVSMDKLDPLEPQELVGIVEQLLDVLDHLNKPKLRKKRDNVSLDVENVHKKAVPLYHADIKPHNVILKKDGTIKLIDFGLANLTISTETTTYGTAEYLSPERAKGESYDFRSELFSLTTTIYEFLTKENLLKGGTDFDSLNNVINKKFDGLTDILVEICDKHNLDKGKVEAFFRKGWEKELDERYQTSNEYLEAFRDAFIPIF